MSSTALVAPPSCPCVVVPVMLLWDGVVCPIASVEGCSLVPVPANIKFHLRCHLVILY